MDIIRATEYKYQDNLQLSDFNNPISIEVFAMESSNSFQISVTGPLENGGIFNYKEYKNLKDLIKDLKFTNILNPYIGVVQNGNVLNFFQLKILPHIILICLIILRFYSFRQWIMSL